MGWSRDLGVVTVSDIVQKVEEATADACGRLSEADTVRREDLLSRLRNNQSVSRAELDEMDQLNKKKSPKMTPEEIATIDVARKVAQEGVRIMGGKAHVMLGGSDRVEGQPEATSKGQRQTSITVTISITSGDAAIEAPQIGKTERDTSTEWEK